MRTQALELELRQEMGMGKVGVTLCWAHGACKFVVGRTPLRQARQAQIRRRRRRCHLLRDACASFVYV